MRKEKLEEWKSYINEFKTIRLQKSLTKLKFIEVQRYDWLLNNKKIISREEIIKNNGTGSAVILLPLTKENNTILVVEPRVFTAETVGIGLPARYVGNFENPIDAAARELEEETGYISNNLVKLADFIKMRDVQRL